MSDLQREIAKRLDAGMTPYHVAMMLGCSSTLVYRVRDRDPDSQWKKVYLTKRKAEELKKLWLEGESGATEIASRLRLPVERVIATICRIERELEKLEATKCQA